VGNGGPSPKGCFPTNSDVVGSCLEEYQGESGMGVFVFEITDTNTITTHIKSTTESTESGRPRRAKCRSYWRVFAVCEACHKFANGVGE